MRIIINGYDMFMNETFSNLRLLGPATNVMACEKQLKFDHFSDTFGVLYECFI